MVIAELRTIQCRVGAAGRIATAIGEALPHRTALSPLAACWITDVGDLNQIIQLWLYDDLAHRASVADKERMLGWPFPRGDDVISEDVVLLEPMAFSPEYQAGAYGSVYEIRTYTYDLDFMDVVEARWGASLPARAARSPFMGAWHTVSGRLDRMVHIWAYDDAAQRQRIRAEAIAAGGWPPNTSAEGKLRHQHSVLAIPTAFSPWH